jgi:hypothetical protein
VVAAPLALLVVLTAAMLWEGGAPVSPVRHLFLVPGVWAALTAGAQAGAFVGVMAGFLQAPLVLPAIERVGLTGGALDGLVSLVTPAILGAVAGHVRDQAFAGARRLEALLEIQRRLAADAPLASRLDAVVDVVRELPGRAGRRARGRFARGRARGGERAARRRAGPGLRRRVVPRLGAGHEQPRPRRGSAGGAGG